jgi:hypothetical protein
MPKIVVNAGPNPTQGECVHGTPTHDTQGHRTPCSPCEDGWDRLMAQERGLYADTYEPTADGQLGNYSRIRVETDR